MASAHSESAGGSVEVIRNSGPHSQRPAPRSMWEWDAANPNTVEVNYIEHLIVG